MYNKIIEMKTKTHKTIFCYSSKALTNFLPIQPKQLILRNKLPPVFLKSLDKS